MLEHLIQDLRYAIRVHSKRPILLVTTTISIGIGVGVNVAMYSVLRTVLTTRMTAAAPETIFRVRPGLSYPNYVDLRTNDAFADLAAMQASTLTYRTGDTTTTIGARVVSENFFEVLGVRALHGRTFGSTNDVRTINDSAVAVISYGFWQRLGGDQTVIGRTLYLNGWPYTIAGVLPDGVYSMIGPLVSPHVYVQLGTRVNRGLEARGAAQFDIVGRLRNGMTRAQISAALRVTAQDLERRFPDANAGLSRTLNLAPDSLVQRVQAPAGLILFALVGAVFAVVGLVLLITCANVAGLLLARAAERAHETSMRIALGASRGRILQQFLAESLVVATLGCVAGATVWTLVMIVLPKTAWFANAGFDLIPATVSLAQCCVLVVVVTVACGIGPGLTANQSASGGLPASRSSFGFRRWSLGKSLVAGQVGVSFILLTGASALLLGLVRQQRADPGFDIAHTVAIQLRLPTNSNVPDFFALRETLRALPGVEAVSSGDLPLGLIGLDRVYKVGATDAGLSVSVNRVGPRYLETVGLHLIQGRDLQDEDVRSPSATVTPAVVGETFARRYLGSTDVIDQQLVLGRDPENGREAQRLQIVGISQDTEVQALGGDPVPILYLPAALSSSLVVRVAGTAATAVRTLERSVNNLVPGAAVTAAPMADRLSGLLLPMRVATLVLTALGGVGLALAMIGLYGVVSYAANRRRFEIGVRIALGASWSAIVRLMMRDTIMMVGVGSIAGSAISFALIRAIWPLLGGSQRSMIPVAPIAVFILMLTVGIVAALRPTLRAAALDPVGALRQD